MPAVHHISPTPSALDQIAQRVWEFTQACGQSPIVVTSTSGSAIGLRQALERHRPFNLPPSLAFLPKIQGLNQWIAQTPQLMDLPPPHSEIKRWAMVYEALDSWVGIRERLGAISEGGRWALAKAIVAACDKLSESTLKPCFFEELASPEAFARLFEEALASVYPDLVRQIVTEDGRLVMAFWNHLSSISDPVPRKQLALSLRARHANQPLVWVETAQATKAENDFFQEFFNRYEERAPIQKIELVWNEVALWPEALLALDQVGSDQVIEQAVQSSANQTLVKANRMRANSENWQVIGAKKFEDVAWTCASRILTHIHAGRTTLGLIAQDRLVARRVRALLARYGSDIVIHDGTGWTLSTTGAAAAVHSWLDVVRAPFGPTVHQLLGFLKNPFIDWQQLFAQKVDHQSQAIAFDFSDFVWGIEQRLHRRQVKGGWQDILRVFFADAMDSHSDEDERLGPMPDAYEFLRLLKERAHQWHGVVRSGKEWLELLFSDLERLAMFDQLSHDLAGKQLINTIDVMATLEGERFSMAAWMSLFDMSLENSTYTEDAQSGAANVHMVTLSAMRMRSFDAVLMVGCDDRHLPSFSDSGLFFSNQLLVHLGMRTMQEEYIQQARDLSEMLIRHAYADFIWQRIGQGDAENNPAAWLLRLAKDVEHMMKPEVALGQQEANRMPIFQAFASWTGGVDYLPRKLSPSAYKTLRECPYRFYVTRILGLRQTINVQEGDANLIGKLLHAILKTFFHELKSRDERLGGGGQDERREWMLGRLRALSEQSFEFLIQRHAKYLSHANDWYDQIDAFIDWQLEREARGWKFHDAEALVGFDLTLDDGVVLRIEGFADRFDIHPTEGAMVMDYKYQSSAKVKERAKYLADDPQLLIYAQAASGENVVQQKQVMDARWITLKLDEKKTNERDIGIEAFDMRLKTLEQQLKEDLSLIWQGADLKAQAPEEVCQYCEARGICRKGMWTQ